MTDRGAGQGGGETALRADPCPLFLFTIVMDGLTNELRQEFSCTPMLADDTVMCREQETLRTTRNIN